MASSVIIVYFGDCDITMINFLIPNMWFKSEFLCLVNCTWSSDREVFTQVS